ncbi:6620_t:CDS:10 [Ambispora gerdemannii]|uniref:TBP-associated factor 6 n=1 Tax=Ambispora gerdemannii TaxID=144530 RepID=A0A9N9FNH7_9GLOM|nr:6620_t:CDS:10 [Ambispora gerdemannii]
MAGFFPKETVKNTAEVVGISNLKDEVALALAHDVEYRLYEIIQEATKFMRHSKRTKLTGDDINHALRVRNVEPLYGFNVPISYKFERLSTNTMDLYYLEDDELDFESLIDAPLPKVPQDVIFTAHWLAVEGVQPLIPHNPTIKGPVKTKITKNIASTHENLESNITEVNGTIEMTNPSTIQSISQEHQRYYDSIVNAVFSLESNDILRNQAFSSLSVDTGINKLLPHFTKLICEKVVENIRNLEVLDYLMNMTKSLLSNETVYLDPHLHQLIPAILTCLVSKRLGLRSTEDHWSLREFAAKIIADIIKRYGPAYHTLKPRITKTLIRALLDPNKSFSTQYGAIVGLSALGPEIIKILMLPNIKTYGAFIRTQTESGDAVARGEAERCLQAVMDALDKLVEDLSLGKMPRPKNLSQQRVVNLREKLTEKLGNLFTEKIYERFQDEDLIHDIFNSFGGEQ